MIKKIFINITVGIISVVVVVTIVKAFTGPGTRTPGTGNPDFWIKNVNDIYYNPAGGGNVGIGLTGPAYKLDVFGPINTPASGGLCIAGVCKTDWNQITGTNYWTLNGSNLYPNLASYLLGVGTASIDSNYKITTSGGGIKAESANQPAGYFNSASGYGLIVNSGNVGIGTASPGEKLEVSGTVKATSFQGDGSQLTGISVGIPSGMIAMFDGACPSGWFRFSALDGRFPRGASSYGGTGGVSYMRFKTGSYPDFGTTSNRGGGLNPVGIQTSADGSSVAQDGTVNLEGGDNIASSWLTILPPYVDVVWCKKN